MGRPGRGGGPGGPARGDRTEAVGGGRFGDDPTALLAPYLQSGEAIPFTVRRGSGLVEFTVEPVPR